MECSYLAVGDADTVRVMSLDPDSCLQSLALQSVPTPPSSVALVRMMCDGACTDIPTVSDLTCGTADGTGHSTLFLNIGLQDGVMLRTVLDNITGELTDTRRRYVSRGRPRKRVK